MTEQINFEQYDVAVPWADIPTSDTVEEGKYVLRIREFKLAGSKEGKLMAMGFFTIEEGPLDGVSFPIQNYVLGTDDDPLCNRDPNTWKKSFGCRQLNQLLEACNVPKDERSLVQTLKRAQQCRFQGYVTKSTQKSGDYAGSDQNRITRYAPYGQEMTIPGQRKAASGMAAGVNGTSVTAQTRQRWRPGQDVPADEPETTQGGHDQGIDAQNQVEPDDIPG